MRLLAITPPASVAPRLDPGLVDAWIRGGALELGIAVLLREPGAELQATLGDPRFAALRVALDDRGIPTLVSAAADAIDEQTAELLIAARPALAGVQLRGDPSVADTQRARDLLGSRMIGRSCHGQTPDPVAHAVDYTCLAPVFAPRTAQPGRPKQAIGLAALARWAAVVPRVLALGGVDPGTASACLAAGASGLAGISLFFG
ncbi:MAG TPA: thiamine phosphate synthase, partial [Enhygromyxa sp.]|nr:thiamine phosphate synthase [Enhygromyxa sp.]